MVKAEPTFLVDKRGLAQILARRGKEFIVTELLQNAWDEKGVTEAHVEFEQADGRATLTITDDAPEGFQDLTHAYTLFAASSKKGNPEQRGRFNLGEKLVIALCETVELTTIKGFILFNDAGRTHNRSPHTQRGTILRCRLKMNRDEADALRFLVNLCIPPLGITTYFNGNALKYRKALTHFTTTLPTEVADAEGYLRPTARQTKVYVYEPLNGEKAMLYELGIPVVETNDTFHVDVCQKVPLNSDRDNVTPSYLQKVRTAVLNEMAGTLTPENSTATWVKAALEDKNADIEAVKAVVTARFGNKVVISDPSDPEGTKMAVAAGYTVLAPRTFSKEAWENVRAAGIQPAGQVTPSPKPYGENGHPERVVDPNDYTDDMRSTVAFARKLAQILIGRDIRVKIVREPKIYWVANFGRLSDLTLNLGKLGHAWFAKGGSEDQIALLLHEFAHNRVSDHLSMQFADEVAALGAKLAIHVDAKGELNDTA